MQPIFLSFVSGVAYRKIVKLHFRSAMRFYLLVSIYENMLFQRFSSFLTAGNKSYCGTLQHLTHPQQSTDSPIPEPVSSSKRQASQRKTFALSSASTQTSSHLRIHGTSVPSTPVDPRYTPGAPQIHPQPHPQCTHSHTSIRPQTHPSLCTHTLPSPNPHAIPKQE